MDNTTHLLDVAQGVNALANGWLFGLILFISFILFFMMFSDRWPTKDVFLADGFFITILAGLFRAAELVPSWALTFPILILVVSLMLKLWGD